MSAATARGIEGEVGMTQELDFSPRGARRLVKIKVEAWWLGLGRRPASPWQAACRPWSEPSRYRRETHSFNKLKHCRRLATRYDRKTAPFLAFLHLVAFALWHNSLSIQPNAPHG